jgi:glycosyltransferase involved in cell wall biosynthesis
MSRPLSVVIITKNEADHIEACLNSVSFAEDVVVLDSGSTDSTCELAGRLGARVFVEEWRGFGPQKRRAVELAQNDWVLSLDADEALDIDAQNFIKELMAEEESSFAAAAYRFARQSYHLGRWIHHGGWTPDYQVRLFDRRRAGWNEAPVHEKVEVREGESLQTARGKIKHWVFEDLSHQVDTNNRYSTLGAEALRQRGKHFSLAKLLLKPVSKFVETYFWKQGFRDGLPGFVISVGAAYSVFLKFAKLWEMEMRAARKPLRKGKDQG